MTICIAAVCTHNDKELFVIATDHMINVNIGQFEHDIKKHKIIHDNNIAMLAGNALIFNELIANIEKCAFTEIKKKIFENFVKLRKDYINKQLLSKFGLNESDITQIVRGTIPNPFTGKILDSIAKFDLKTSILLVGYENGTAQIAEIREHGFADFSDIHFHAIGSGQIQAANTLLFQKQSKSDSLKTAIYNVYKAKRNAEVSSGVGKETDMMVLTENGCFYSSQDDLKTLSGIYKEELQLGKNSGELNKLGILNNEKFITSKK